LVRKAEVRQAFGDIHLGFANKILNDLIEAIGDLTTNGIKMGHPCSPVWCCGSG